MALTYKPPFAQFPKMGLATLTAALTARDGSGTIATLLTAGADGALVKRIKFIPAQATAAATTAKTGFIFLSTDGGSTWQFFREVALPTTTPSTTAIGSAGTVEVNFPDGLAIPASAKVGVSITVYTGVQDRTQVIGEYADY